MTVLWDNGYFRGLRAAWWEPWNWYLYRDGRWNWFAFRVGIGWSVAIGPFRISNVRVRKVESR